MNKKKVLYWAVIAAVFGLIIIPYGAMLFYTLPRSDEFSCLINATIDRPYTLKEIFRIVIGEYQKWEGNYSGVFFYILFNPMLTKNAELSMYIYNIVSYSFFVAVGLYAFYKVARIADLSKANAFIIATVLFGATINCRYLHETLGWYTGYLYYTFQLLTGTLAIIIVAGISDNKGIKGIKEYILLILALLLSFIGCGGTLQISGMLCCLTLVLLIWNIWKKKDFIKAAILFAVTFASTLLNLASPGHSVRKDNYEQISLFKAAAYAIYCIFKEVVHLCKDTYLLFVLLGVGIFTLLVLKSSKKGLEYNPLIILLIGFATTFAGVFPVCYGYGGYELASRGYETTDLSLAFFGGALVISIANFLKGRDLVPDKKKTVGIALIILLLAAVTSHFSIEDHSLPNVKCIRGLADGSIKDYSDRWREAWRQIVNSPGEDVVIEMEEKYMEAEEVVCRPLISGDPQHWINLSMTYFYKNKSIRLEVIK